MLYINYIERRKKGREGMGREGLRREGEYHLTLQVDFEKMCQYPFYSEYHFSQHIPLVVFDNNTLLKTLTFLSVWGEKSGSKIQIENCKKIST